jgi:HlyD family secretion protein
MLASALGACQSAQDDGTVVGTLEQVEVDVGPLQPARALRVLVDEGDAVTIGDTLVVFSTPTLAATGEQLEARAVAAARAAEELARGARPAEIGRARAEAEAATAEAERAAADLARLEPLAARGDISRQQLGAARAAVQVSASRRDAAREALRLVEEGARRERREAAVAEAQSARAAVEAWRATAGDLVLRAPVDGVVTSRHVEPGEVLGAGQSAISVGQPSRPWARVYVSSAVLSRLKIGDSVTAWLDGDSARFVGRVVSVSSRAEFTPRVALTEQERADLLFGVRIEFAAPVASNGATLRAGLPITVRLPAAAAP